jgi:nitrogen regulatory protein P-II 1
VEEWSAGSNEVSPIERAVCIQSGTIRWGYGTVTMKQVIAVVKPYLAEKVLEALKLAPLEACTVREVKGYGRQKSYLDEYHGSEYSLAFLPKVEITLWVDDLRVEEVVRTVVDVARTGRMGDGKIFVLPLLTGDEWPIP